MTSKVAAINGYVSTTVSGDDSVFLLDKSETLAVTIDLASETKLARAWCRVAAWTVSNKVPNIFSITGYNNRIIKVRLGAGAWQTVDLNPGIYSPESIGEAVNDAIHQLGWWVDPTDPGFIFSGNDALSKVDIVIDSTKTVGGAQLSLDLSASEIGNVLGYSPVYQIMTTDGTFESDITPILDTQGSKICLNVDEGPSRNVNGASTKIIAIVSLVGSQSAGLPPPNEVIFPNSGEISPRLDFPNRRVSTLTVRFTREDGSTPIYFLGGSGFSLVMEFGNL
jgi:hypothetical protein